jgi:hypothetical protein
MIASGGTPVKLVRFPHPGPAAALLRTGWRRGRRSWPTGPEHDVGAGGRLQLRRCHSCRWPPYGTDAQCAAARDVARRIADDHDVAPGEHHADMPGPVHGDGRQPVTPLAVGAERADAEAMARPADASLSGRLRRMLPVSRPSTTRQARPPASASSGNTPGKTCVTWPGRQLLPQPRRYAVPQRRQAGVMRRPAGRPRGAVPGRSGGPSCHRSGAYRWGPSYRRPRAWPG